MTARSVQLVVLPRVLDDNSLEFDPNGPVPTNLPYFVRDAVYPNRFHPDFDPCKYRGFIFRKLTNCETCTRERKVWYCNLYQKEVFPIECKSCQSRCDS